MWRRDTGPVDLVYSSANTANTMAEASFASQPSLAYSAPRPADDGRLQQIMSRPASFEWRQDDGRLQQMQVSQTHAQVSKDTIKIDMEIKFPQKEKKKKAKPVQGSLLSAIFKEQRFPEPMYFQNVDCVGLPSLLSSKECNLIIDYAEAQGFSVQQRHRVLNLMWSDVVDPFFAEALWQFCGLGWFLRTISIDGMVPCGLNDVIRIQKYVQGSLFGRHTDQPVRREDGKISKYSLRIFLNGREDDEVFTGGLSVFHVPFRQEPVVFEPEAGLGLLYPQGELCTIQEETEVLFGCKYVLRADVLFCKPEDLQRR